MSLKGKIRDEAKYLQSLFTHYNVVLIESNRNKLIIGNQTFARDEDGIRKEGVKSIIRITHSDLPDFDGVEYLKLDLGDEHNLTTKQMKKIVSEFTRTNKFITDSICRGSVLIHCDAGQSRSATIVIAYIMWSKMMDVQSAFDLLESKRYLVDPNTGFVKCLRMYDEYLQKSYAYVVPKDVRVFKLKCTESFEKLDSKCKNICYWFNEAQFHGTRVILQQVSEESVSIFDMFVELFKCFLSFDDFEGKSKLLLETTMPKSDAEIQFTGFISYFCFFIGNFGNYLGFGDTKFIPRVSMLSFRSIVQNSGSVEALRLFELVKDKMYSLAPRYRSLGFHGSFLNSCYCSDNITKEDIEFVQLFLEEQSIGVENTMLSKDADPTTREPVFILKIASISSSKKEFTFKGKKIVVEQGMFSRELKNVNECLKNARKHCEKDGKVYTMISSLVNHFKKGDVEYHKEASKFWVETSNSPIEFHCGFVESYRDRSGGGRCEFEGFLGITDKSFQEKCDTLVEKSSEILRTTPFFKYNLEVKSPSFKSLAALKLISGCVSSYFGAVFLPNYVDISEKYGQKNFAITNVYCIFNETYEESEKINFVSSDDEKLLKLHNEKAEFVHCALHELLGHGSGKLLRQTSDEEYNFEKDEFVHPISGKRLTVGQFYKKNETYYTRFGTLGNAYEETRAEVMSMFLCFNKTVMEVMKCGDDANYVIWMNMVLSGLNGLTFYNEEIGDFTQDHFKARFSIVQVLMKRGNGVLKIVVNEGENDFIVVLEKERIKDVGIKIIGEYLLKLQVYRSTGEVLEGKKLFDEYTKVDDDFKLIRRIVIEKRKELPAKIPLQNLLTFDKNEGKVHMKQYPATQHGVYDYFVDRFLRK